MLLHRVTPDPFQVSKISESNVGQYPDSITCVSEMATAKFDRFGNGSRRSDFELYIDWSDIEELISRFSQVGNPAAIELQNALKASRALTVAGWRPPEPSN